MFAAQAAPSVVLVFLVVVLCAIACKDAFNDEVHESAATKMYCNHCVWQVVDSETGKAYFDTMRHSLTTSFRMLVGEWHDAMFQAVEETTEATQLW